MVSRVIRDLLSRRVPQILGVYLAVGWGVLEFTDWLVNHYLLSPQLVDLALAAWALMIPTVIMLAYYHGRPGRDRWATLEKVGIPLNVVVTLLVLYFTFSGEELGAATRQITVRDETGQEIEREVPKAAFRKRLVIYYFTSAPGDTALDWLQYGFPLALQNDLLQDIFMDVRGSYLINERLQRAGYPDGTGLPLALRREIAEEWHLSHFVSGTISGRQDSLHVSVSLYDVDRGSLVEERTYTGPDLFELVDAASLQLKRDLEVPEGHIEESRDLPVAEMLTNSQPAYRHFVEGWRAFESNDWQRAAPALARAVEEDPAFSYANLLLFQTYIGLGDTENAKVALEAAMQHSYKLPERYQFAMKTAYYRVVRQDIERALAVAGAHAELFPDDISAHSILFLLYMQTGEREKAIAAAKRVLDLDPGEYSVLRALGNLYERAGDFDEAARYFQGYAERAPTDPQAFNELGDLSRSQGMHDRAREYYERALVLEPSDVGVLVDLARNEAAVGELEQAEVYLGEALEAATTPLQRFLTYATLQEHFTRRGELTRAIENMHLAWAALEQAAPPLDVFDQKLEDISLYVMAGRDDAARTTLNEIRGQLSPPLDLFLAIGQLGIALEREDPDQLARALEGMDSLIAKLGLGLLRPRALHGRGRLLEVRGECDQAVIAYERAIELEPTAVAWNLDIGRCYRKLGRYDEAQTHLQRVLTAEPFAPRANLEIAKVFAETGQSQRAVEHLHRALHVWKNADPEFRPAQEAREALAAVSRNG